MGPSAAAFSRPVPKQGHTTPALAPRTRGPALAAGLSGPEWFPPTAAPALPAPSHARVGSSGRDPALAPLVLPVGGST